MKLLDRKPSMGTNPCHLYLDETEGYCTSVIMEAVLPVLTGSVRRALSGACHGDPASRAFRG
ncbi:MAG: hypothetical protein ACLRMZ_20590 [Blautia marasmi]